MKLPSGILCWVEFDAVFAAIALARKTGDVSVLPGITCARDLRRHVVIAWMTPSRSADSFTYRRPGHAGDTYRELLEYFEPALLARDPRDEPALWRWLEGPEFSASLEELYASVEKARLEVGHQPVRQNVVAFRRDVPK